MGTVIGPIQWSPTKRFESWFLLRTLREDVKQMKKEDPERYSSAIYKEEQIINEEFKKYVEVA